MSTQTKVKMMMSLRLPLALLCLLQLSAAPSYGFREIKKFNEKFFPSVGSDLQYIPHLGSVAKLDTLIKNKDSTKLPTLFAIYNRRNQVREIKFTPSQYCIAGACQGPFQYDLNALDRSRFDPKLKTVIMISGYLTGERVGWLDRTKDLWLAIEDLNVIIVTWKEGADSFYPQAVANTPLIARQITILLHYLAELNGVSLRDENFLRKVHFVGHSLGAHVGGFFGQDLGGKLGRITALDPAGPSFDLMGRTNRLDREDAILVDVIHTNGGKMRYANAIASGILNPFTKLISKTKIQTDSTYELNTAWFGISDQSGDVDYYANNGKVQPGCEDFIHICDHGRSHQILEDLLMYQLQLKQLDTTKKDPKQHRLMAFRSQDFKSFQNGNNLETFGCKAFLNDNPTVFDLEQTIKPCSIAIDLVSPLEDLIEEFKSEHGIDVYESDYRSDHKFWFMTHPKSPLLADHQILRVQLDHHSNLWDESCSLKIKIFMNDDQSSYSELNKVNLNGNGDFAIPFAVANSAWAREALNQILDNSTSLTNMRHVVFTALPTRVELQVTKASTWTESIKAKISSIFWRFSKSDREKSKKCSLNIAQMSIQPITNHKRKLVASYSSDRVYRFNYDTLHVTSSNPIREEPVIFLTPTGNQEYTKFTFDSLYIQPTNTL